MEDKSQIDDGKFYWFSSQENLLPLLLNTPKKREVPFTSDLVVTEREK